LPREAWQELLASGAVRRFEKGEILMRQGEPGRYVFILVAGRVKVARVDADGNELLLAVRGVADIVGELAVLGGEMRSATVTALVPCIRREAALALAKTENLRVLLADPTTARLWWLENSPGKLDNLVTQKMDDIFEKVADLFGEPACRPAADPIAELIRVFLRDLDGRCRERLIDQLRHVFTAYERGDLADALDA
jgi:Cyclic nucleotide-binding domain